MKLFRRIIFSLFVLAYLMLCPLTILYAFGYSFRPGSERGLVKTGLIYLSTNPSGASVYLGKRRFTHRTPAMLRGLLPGQYPVRVSLKGYRPWEQWLPVEPEKATALEHILLLPLQLHPDVKLDGPVDGLVPVPGSRFFLLARGPSLGEWHVYDWKEGKSWPLLAGHAGWASAKVLAQFTVKESPWILFRVEQPDGEHWLWIEMRRGETDPEDLTRLMVEPPETVEWEPHSHRHLFAIQHGWVDRLETADKATSPKWLEHVRGFGLSGRAVYVLKDDGLLVKMDRDGKDAEPVLELPMTRAPVFGRPSFFRIHAVAPGVVLLLGARGELLMNRAPYLLADNGVIGCEGPPRRQRALVWTHEQIGVIHLPEELFEFEREGNAPHLRWVYQQGRQIEQACWLDEGFHVLVRDAGQLSVLELDTYGASRLEPLVETADAPFVYAEDAGAVYYLERSTGRLMMLQILPKHELLPLPVLDESGQHAR